MMDQAARARFLDRVCDSETSRWRVVQWFSVRGYALWLPPAIPPGVFVNFTLGSALRLQFETIMATSGRPLCYVTVNPSCSHIAVVMTRGWQNWTIDQRASNDKELPAKEYYIASLDDVRFYSLACDKPDWSESAGDQTL
jgi:hypothetical protein